MAEQTAGCVLFADVSGSTKLYETVGDAAAHAAIDLCVKLFANITEQHGGRVIRSTGDGVLAIFDGPGRAVQCALSLRDVLRTLAIDIRAGIHTGEIEVGGDEISGIGVHVAARVVSRAENGQIWVSSVVPLLMTGSNVEFEPRGEWVLKGVPGEWSLFAVRS